jgi:hypothetical protein
MPAPATEVGYMPSDDQSLHLNNPAYTNWKHHTLTSKPQSEVALCPSLAFAHR